MSSTIKCDICAATIAPAEQVHFVAVTVNGMMAVARLDAHGDCLSVMVERLIEAFPFTDLSPVLDVLTASR